MNVRQQDARRYGRAWVVFALFVALPSVALAVAGVRAISADDTGRVEARRRRAEFVARNASDSILAALPSVNVTEALKPIEEGRTIFRREVNGTFSFPQHRVFIAEFGVIPASMADGDGGAGDVPDAIVAAVSSQAPGIQRQALEQLRAGTWWLHLDQRRAYDRELVKRLVTAGITGLAPVDSRLDALAQVHAFVTSAISAGTPGRASSVQTQTGISLIVWSPATAGSTMGLVIDPPGTAALIHGAFAELTGEGPMAAEIGDARGRRVWRLNELSLPGDAVVHPIYGVDGWTLRLSLVESSPRRSWWVYGLVVLPIALLGFGLVLTSRVVRREVELARRQAEFTAAVTHEFKSPITSLRLLMERIVSGRVEGGAALAGYHDAIMRETNRLDSLVSRLLDAQQIQAGKRRHEPVLAAIGPIIDSAVDRFRDQAAAKRINLRTNVPNGEIELSLDRHSVSDALDNLIDNALKYSAADSVVTVAAAADGSHAAIAVQDHGSGIDRDDLPHVFEPYYRGRLGDRESVRGTGLGLALVQAAAEAHGGTVDVLSTPGKGSTFTLRLPLRRPS